MIKVISWSATSRSGIQVESLLYTFACIYHLSTDNGYINDLLPTLKNCKGLCFADDTKLISRILGTESTARLQEDLCMVIDWSTVNNMELHEDKFQLLSYPLNSSHLFRQLPFYSEN